MIVGFTNYLLAKQAGRAIPRSFLLPIKTLTPKGINMPRANKQDYKIVSFELPASKADELLQLSKLLGCNRSDLIRVALSHYVPIVTEENKELIETNKKIMGISA